MSSSSSSSPAVVFNEDDSSPSPTSPTPLSLSAAAAAESNSARTGVLQYFIAGTGKNVGYHICQVLLGLNKLCKNPIKVQDRNSTTNMRHHLKTKHKIC